MTDFKKTLKALALLLGLAVAMPFSAQAQTTKSMYHEGSLMDDPMADWHKQPSLNNRDGGLTATWTFNNEEFGLPLGGGIAILLAAGAGYVIIRRRKEDEQ